MKDVLYYKVEVITSAKNETLKQTGPHSFAVSVKEKPENNAANKRVIECIAKHFHVGVGNVRIKSGHRRPRKLLAITKQ